MISLPSSRRVVVTGIGIVGPLGLKLTGLWNALSRGLSGISDLRDLDLVGLPFPFGGVAREFTGDIEEFDADATQRRQIRKGLKLMCREIQMGVAAAQAALRDAQLEGEDYDPERFGVSFGSDHIVAAPEEFFRAYRATVQDSKRFDIRDWGRRGMSEITPLWLLKYLPNMPASHVAIYNDLRGPNNSITQREVSGSLAIAEAAATIRRGAADRMLVGATGSSIGPLRALHASFIGEIVTDGDDPSTAVRPFDVRRQGAVPAEGSVALILEDRASAQRRNAPMYAEYLGAANACVTFRNGAADICRAIEHAARAALLRAATTPSELTHVHSHGNATRSGDMQEAIGLATALEQRAVPVVAGKSYFGSLGAAGGLMEIVCSILANRHAELFPTLNVEQPDKECPIHVQRERVSIKPGPFLTLSYTPSGQAAAVILGP